LSPPSAIAIVALIVWVQYLKLQTPPPLSVGRFSVPTLFQLNAAQKNEQRNDKENYTTKTRHHAVDYG